jgi:hypothetical protein
VLNLHQSEARHRQIRLRGRQQEAFGNSPSAGTSCATRPSAPKGQETGAEIDEVSMEGCDGNAASLHRIAQGWMDANVRNAVVLTGFYSSRDMAGSTMSLPRAKVSGPGGRGCSAGVH